MRTQGLGAKLMSAPNARKQLMSTLGTGNMADTVGFLQFAQDAMSTMEPSGGNAVGFGGNEDVTQEDQNNALASGAANSVLDQLNKDYNTNFKTLDEAQAYHAFNKMAGIKAPGQSEDAIKANEMKDLQSMANIIAGYAKGTGDKPGTKVLIQPKGGTKVYGRK